MAPSSERFTGFPFKKSATLLTGFETYPWGGATTQNPEPLNNGAQANNVQDVCAVPRLMFANIEDSQTWKLRPSR